MYCNDCVFKRTKVPDVVHFIFKDRSWIRRLEEDWASMDSVWNLWEMLARVYLTDMDDGPFNIISEAGGIMLYFSCGCFSPGLALAFCILCEMLDVKASQ